MKQISLNSTGFERKTKQTHKREFLDEMNLLMPWSELVALVIPHASACGTKGGLPSFAALRVHFLQQWLNLSYPPIKEALYETPMFREFVGLDMGEDLQPDESTILRFRHLLEVSDLSFQILAKVNATLTGDCVQLMQGTLVDATLIAATTTTKNGSNTRDPNRRHTKKGNQWYYGMKAHIGAGADSGLGVLAAADEVNATLSQRLYQPGSWVIPIRDQRITAAQPVQLIKEHLPPTLGLGNDSHVQHQIVARQVQAQGVLSGRRCSAIGANQTAALEVEQLPRALNNINQAILERPHGEHMQLGAGLGQGVVRDQNASAVGVLAGREGVERALDACIAKVQQDSQERGPWQFAIAGEGVGVIGAVRQIGKGRAGGRQNRSKNYAKSRH